MSALIEYGYQHPDQVAAAAGGLARAARSIASSASNLYQSNYMKRSRSYSGLAQRAAFGSKSSWSSLDKIQGRPSKNKKRRISKTTGSTTNVKMTYGSKSSKKRKRRSVGNLRSKKPRYQKMTKSKVKSIVKSMQRAEHATGHYKVHNSKCLDAIGGGSGLTTNSWSYIDNLSDITQTDADGLQLFSPAQVLDAASVCFNGKTPAYDYDLTTNNLSSDTKIDVIKQEATFKLYNNTVRPACVQLIKLIALDMKPSRLASIKSELDTLLTEAGVPYDSLAGMYGFYNFPSVTNEYYVVVKNFYLKPGQRAQHTMYGSRGVYDMQLMEDNDHFSGVTTYVMVRAKGLTVSGLDGTNNTIAGYDNINYASDPDSGQGIVVTKEQLFVIKAPESIDSAVDTWKSLDSGQVFQHDTAYTVEKSMPVEPTKNNRLVNRVA